MKYLNLDNQFEPLGKSIAFEAFTFSGGEPHIKIKEELSFVDQLTITTRINSFNDFGLLLVAVDATRRMGVESISLFLPYFPGARQDRLMTQGEPLTVKVFADLINNMNFNKVSIIDPHSEVTSALIDHLEVISTNPFVEEATKELSDFYLISPDAGSQKKIYSTSKYLGGIPVVECSKKRDVESGKLSGFEVNHEDLGGKTCVVVDDICDGGGTFMGLAKELKKKNAGLLYLIVTHGIFSKNTDVLASVFDKVFTTDSIRNNTPSIQTIELKNILS